MDKIKQLMMDAGLSEEAALQVCESLKVYKGQLAEDSKVELQGKLKAAKAACIEEMNKHKVELSRRTQIFLEAKTNQVLASARKNIVNEESEAVATLNKITGLIEGVEIQGQPNSELTKLVKSLKSQVISIKEEKQAAVTKANQNLKMADKTLKDNRYLTRKLHEADEKLKKAAISEGRSQKRIDNRRSKGQSKTTQRTLVENQRRSGAPARKPAAQAGQPGPAQIAENME
jgi:hypothetical protein